MHALRSGKGGRRRTGQTRINTYYCAHPLSLCVRVWGERYASKQGGMHNRRESRSPPPPTQGACPCSSSGRSGYSESAQTREMDTTLLMRAKSASVPSCMPCENTTSARTHARTHTHTRVSVRAPAPANAPTDGGEGAHCAYMLTDCPSILSSDVSDRILFCEGIRRQRTVYRPDTARELACTRALVHTHTNARVKAMTHQALR